MNKDVLCHLELKVLQFCSFLPVVGVYFRVHRFPKYARIRVPVMEQEEYVDQGQEEEQGEEGEVNVSARRRAGRGRTRAKR